ncbi:hypothetical protein BS17DRAFT_768732 [Gyrodon lividus]|nr:hypothetical protein BS17DRAFT_768732 [Gyrodon lividus]
MPASLSSLKQCSCEECIEKGGAGVDRKPKGMLMEARLLATHLKCVKDKHTAWNAPTSAPSPNSSTNMDQIAGQLFALTLTDDGPKSLTSKLWNSCTEFQQTGPNSSTITQLPDPLSISDITNSLNHLRFKTTAQAVPSSSPSLSPLSPQSRSLVSSQPNNAATLPPHYSPALLVSGCRLSKKDHNHHTVKALQILSNIKSHVQCCYRLLLNSSSYQDMKHQLATLRQAIDRVNRATESVKAQKKRLPAMLDDLGSQIST